MLDSGGRKGKSKEGKEGEENRIKPVNSLLPLSLLLNSRTPYPKVLKTKGRKDIGGSI